MCASGSNYRELTFLKRDNTLSHSITQAEPSLSASFTAACIQLCTTRDVKVNCDAIVTLIREAAHHGAQYIQTPEMSNVLERDRHLLFEKVTTPDQDSVLNALREEARRLNVYIHIGSLAVRSGAFSSEPSGAQEGQLDSGLRDLKGGVSEGNGIKQKDLREKLANRAFVIDPTGAIIATYDKMHLFDVDLPNGESWCESNTYIRGNEAISVDLPWGKLGLAICYDLRFPMLFHTLAQREAIFLSAPAAFTRQTGEAHWQVLQRARAIETGSFMISAAQGGHHDDGRETYGHSIIVDPWGRILAEATGDFSMQTPQVIYATIDSNIAYKARSRIPTLQHVRHFDSI